MKPSNLQKGIVKELTSIDSTNRLYWITFLAAIGIAIPMCISHSLWLGQWQRSFPLSTVFTLVSPTTNPHIPYPLDLMTYCTMLALLLRIGIHARPYIALPCFLVVAIVYSAFDVNRFMPYYVQFYWILLVVWLTQIKERKHPTPQNTNTPAINATQQHARALVGLILVGIWFWSGLHKLNTTYVFQGFPWLITPIAELFPETWRIHIASLGLFSALIEAGAAIALIFPPTRRPGIAIIVLMHLSILYCIGPFGHAYNPSVWSWNVVQPLLCILVFGGSQLQAREILLPRGVLHLFVALWFVLAPACAELALWPRSLSYTLYAWRSTESYIHAPTSKGFSSLPKRIQQEDVKNENGSYLLPLKEWAYADILSPPFDADFVYRSTFTQFCDGHPNAAQLRLRIHAVPQRLREKRNVRTIRCPE